ncbi:MAG: peptidoglycan bridge formation glycyltransferase FemA/FemB family protein [Chloroflexota bacterium]|jgi:lipid II:glycine glycyltransferase (peptidoglycan interpeptide bridge formation enzyme)
MPILDSKQWNAFLSQHPSAHLLQTDEWGQLKAAFGWKPVKIGSPTSGAQILFRALPLGFSIAYIPKGPVGKEWGSLLPEIDEVCRRQRAIFLKIEPDRWEDEAAPLLLDGIGAYRQLAKPIQPRRTVEIDLAGSETDWLARMKQKTRYNIRLAQRKEVNIEFSADVAEFHRMILITGKRDGFGVHSLGYYQRAYDLFAPRGMCALLMARYDCKTLAALMVFAHGERGWYFYGASTDEERSRMPTYLLQWEAMRWAAARGCRVYDLWGIPDEDEQVLESEFANREDGLWGVYRFKRGFGGRVRRAVSAWDVIYSPALYRIYTLYTRFRSGEG